jgi:hypothetical protein
MKSGLLKAFILGVGITFLSSGMAFAGTEEIMPVKGEAQDSVILRGAGSSPDEVGPTEPVLYDKGMDTPIAYEVNEELLKKQSEIDIYLFKEHYEEIREKGIFITHTGPLDSVVEIGITPYSDANAEYLYGIFGKDMVAVVEGQVAQLTGGAEPALEAEIKRNNASAPDEIATTDVQILNAPPADGTVTDADLAATSGESEKRTLSASAQESADVKDESIFPMTLVYSLGALVLLGSAALVMKRKAITINK